MTETKTKLPPQAATTPADQARERMDALIREFFNYGAVSDPIEVITRMQEGWIANYSPDMSDPGQRRHVCDTLFSVHKMATFFAELYQEYRSYAYESITTAAKDGGHHA